MSQSSVYTLNVRLPSYLENHHSPFQKLTLNAWDAEIWHTDITHSARRYLREVSYTAHNVAELRPFFAVLNHSPSKYPFKPLS